ncbi:hypothetical protein [Nostoc sp.]|uniref:hypothetical protein n=1 Tax=Nostoc sp. TaxID=1180 RepID=UPI002FF2927E
MIPQPREQIYYESHQFVASDEATRSHFLSLQKHHNKITEVLRRCDFQLIGYRITGDDILINKGNGIEFSEKDEGKGFVICLHLLGYLFDGQSVDSESFRYYLHPILFTELEKCFGRFRYF